MRAIDNLLQKNPYIGKLSEADRIAVYNEAIKRIATLREYTYTNQSTSDQLVINTQYELSDITSIDNIISPDISSLSVDERLLIYNMVQDRIATLRVLQHSKDYEVINSTFMLDIYTSMILPIAFMIYNPATSVKDVHQVIRQLPLSNKLFNYLLNSQEMILELPIKNQITNCILLFENAIRKFPLTFAIISGLSKNQILQIPIANQVINVVTDYKETKIAVIPITFTINSLEQNNLRTTNITLPISNTIIAISTYQNYQERDMKLPISFIIQ
jgi:hypothetical protein